MKEFNAVWLTFIYSIFLIFIKNATASSNQKLCGNADCSIPISRAKTLINYIANREDRISFQRGVDVEVFSKKDNEWGVKVNGKIGFAPNKFLRESKVYIASRELVASSGDVSPKPVKVESTQNESVDQVVEKTKEISSGIGSLLSFPSMASAESVEAPKDTLPTPSSPQHEVVDGTTIWLDPLPPSQVNQETSPNSSDLKVKENSDVPNSSPENSGNVEQSSSLEINAVTDGIPNSAEVTEAPSPDVVTPVPFDNFVTPSSQVDGQLETLLPDPAASGAEEVIANGITEATIDTSTETLTETSTETLTEALTEQSTEGTVPESPNNSVDESTDSEDIQPTQAGIMTNLWNSMNSVFNSGDGTEENSQENDGEEEEDGEDGEESDEEDAEEGSSGDISVQANQLTNASDPPAIDSDTSQDSSSTPVSTEDIAPNVVVENVSPGTVPYSEDLASSFPQAEGNDPQQSVRIPRQVETASDAVTSEEAIEQVSREQMDSVESVHSRPGPVDWMVQRQEEMETVSITQNKSSELGQIENNQRESVEQGNVQAVDENHVVGEDLKSNAEEEQKQSKEEDLKKQEEEIEKQEEDLKKQEEEREKQEEELKKQEEERARQEEELKKQEEVRVQQEEELKKQEEERKRLMEEELRKQEEESNRLKEEEIKKQEEEIKKQEEERKRLMEEELRKQVEESNRLKEEERKKQEQEEVDKKRKEEENRKIYDEELEMWRKNQEKQQLREEQMKREREEAKRLQEAQKLQEDLEREQKQNQVVAEAIIPETEDNISSPQNAIAAEQESTSEGMFSWFSGLFGSSVEPDQQELRIEESQQQQTSQDSPALSTSPPHNNQHEHATGHRHEYPPVWSAAQQTMCSASEAGCDMKSESEAEVEASSIFLGIQAPSLDIILLRLAATAVALLMGALSFYFLRKKHVDSSLVARINELEKQILVASKEAVILREEASTAGANVNSEELNSLQEELESYRLIKADLEEQVSTLERELEEATETGIELNKLLSETLEASKGKAHAGLAASVERLQQQLDSQKDKVDSLTRSLKSTCAENENLKSVVSESREKISALEAELAAAAEIANNIRREREESNVLAAQELQQVQSRLEEALSSKVLEESRLHSELSALKLRNETLRSSLSMKDAEVKALQNTLKELESGGDKADQLLDVSKVRAELEYMKNDRNDFEEKYLEEERVRKDLEDRFGKITETLKKLEEKVDLAEKNKEDAETRLAVLSNYFKEKEEQLQKELGLKEAIVAQHQGDESTVVKHLQLLQEEVSTYRAQNESLKKEILDQERDFKGQIATLEKKAHDNWMTARQAERRLEDSRQEAAQLRNRLTLVEKSNADPNTRLDANGEGGVASPVMMMPLPPLGDMETPPPLPPFMFSPPPYPPPFMPPPLPPHPMGRPPPLGRMSSPPPPLGQFSPPPPPYDRLDRSSRSPSPPPHRYHHRSPPPPQWDAPPSGFRPVPKPSPKKPNEQRDHKGSVHNSGHSSESMDKSREHV